MRASHLVACAAVLLGTGCLEAPTVSVSLDAGHDAITADGAIDHDAAQPGDAGENGFDADAGADAGATIPRQACDRDEDCTHALRSRCDLTKHECAACRTSAQCSRVSNAPVCIAAVGCFPCSDTDTSKCPTGRTLCEPTTHQCVRCVDTINETTCAGGQHCLDNECVQCRNAMDCPLATASVCNAQHQCEGCNAKSDCDQIAGKTLCNTGEHTCVSCLSNTDCTLHEAGACDTTTGTCKPCANDGDCKHFSDAQVCEDGQCVECSRDKRAACDGPDGSKNVCNAITHTCSNSAPASADDCGECVSDVQCKAGYVCVPMGFGGVSLGHFCQPTTTSNCAGTRPYFKLASDTITIDKASADVCTLRVSTCAALSDYSRKDCGVNTDADPEPEQGDNSLCGAKNGATDLADGYCLEFQPGLYRCTVACNNDVSDCPTGSGSCDTSFTPDLCAL